MHHVLDLATGTILDIVDEFYEGVHNAPEGMSIQIFSCTSLGGTPALQFRTLNSPERI